MTTEPMTEPLSPTITFTEVPMTAELIDAAMPLLEAHYKEIAHYLDIPLAIDKAMYLQSAALGMVRTFLFMDDGVLQGYAVFFCKLNMHYATSLQAVQDVLYISPKHRGQLLGTRFIAWCDEQLRKSGVQVVMHHMKLAHDFGPTMERLGYEKVEVLWSKRLDRRD